MFCSSCGEKINVENAKYCSNWGKKLKFDKSVDTSAHTAPKKITYEEFKRRKEEKRSLKFKFNNLSKRAKIENSASSNSLQSVTFQVGQMIAKDGDLRIKRGANLPLKVSQFINQDELKTRAVHTGYIVYK